MRRLPGGFGEGEGMMEKIRPESVTGEEYLPSPEHLEIMGEPRRGAGVPRGDAGEEAPVEQISEVTVAPGEEAEVPKEDWPVEEGPPSETLEKPTPPPPAPPPSRGRRMPGRSSRPWRRSSMSRWRGITG